MFTRAPRAFFYAYSKWSCMAIKTYTEQLESVQAAIASIESGAQSAQFQGRGWTKAELRVLYEREKWLIPLAAREARGRRGIPMHGVTPVDL